MKYFWPSEAGLGAGVRQMKNGGCREKKPPSITAPWLVPSSFCLVTVTEAHKCEQLAQGSSP